MDGALGEQCSVEVTVVVENRRIGTDRGVVWFVDDLMGFPKASDVVVTPLLGHGRSDRRRFRGFAHGGPGTEDERLRRFVLREESSSAEPQWSPLKPYGETAPAVTRR